ncbi:hypothetical protein LTR08_005066 [Meristemomyces frigidus]|nr:hypothetical protein LTR08_005066 [Meristemomyces frigidus]
MSMPTPGPEQRSVSSSSPETPTSSDTASVPPFTARRTPEQDSSEPPPSYPEVMSAPMRYRTTLLIMEIDNHKRSLKGLIDGAKRVLEQARVREIQCTRAEDPTLSELGERVVAFIAEEVKQSGCRLDMARAWLRKNLVDSERQARRTLSKLADKHFLPPKSCRGSCTHVHFTRRERVMELEDLIAQARSRVTDACGCLDPAEFTWRKRLLMEWKLE